MSTRTKRVADKSIAAIPAESIPFIGVAVLITDTGYELYAACETGRWSTIADNHHYRLAHVTRIIESK
jgi:hypothetical protein